MKKKTRDRAPRMRSSERRDHILKHASQLTIRHGAAGFTLEDVAVDGRISKALVYKHFANREALIKALAEREVKALRKEGLSDLPKSLSFEDSVQEASARLFRYLDERGPVLHAILSDRDAGRRLGGENADTHTETTDFFLEKAKKNFQLPPDAALICALLAANAPFGSARALKRHRIDPERAAEIWSAFTTAGWAAVAKQFGRGGATARGARRRRAHANGRA